MTYLRRPILKILERCFRRIDLPPSLQSVLSENGRITVVAQSDSILVQALLDSFAVRSGLKCALYASETERRPEVLYWCSLHDEANLERCLHTAPKFSTLNIFHGRGPVKTNPRYHAGLWQLLSAMLGQMLKSRYYLTLFGEPFELSARAQPSRSQISRRLKLNFYQMLKRVRGTPLQSLEAQARVVLAGRDFERESALLAKRHGKSLDQIKELARKEFYAIAAKPSGFVLGLCDALARFILNRLFTQVISEGLERFSALIKQHPAILVPMHRSHLDYIIISSKLYEANLIPPLVAAGINLAFWPAGFVLRGAGAYFVRREASQNFIHSFILQRYVTYLLKRGHLQEFFIEGGRSRSGRMLTPKHGLLSIVTTALQKGVRKEVFFIPVSISYEQVVEENSYSEENSGQAKRRESFWELLKARRIFRKKHGEVIVNFGEPLSLAGFAAAWKLSAGTPENERKSLLIHLGDELKQRIAERTNLSLASLFYSALLMAPRYGLTQPRLVDTISRLADLGARLRRINPGIGDFTPSLQLFLKGRHELLFELAGRGGVSVKQLGDVQVFFLPADRRFSADFYRNTCCHLFFGVSLMAILHLLDEDLSLEGLMRHHALFSPDFLPIRKDQAEAYFNGLRQLLSDHKVLTTRGRRLAFKETSGGFFFPALLWAQIESLFWVGYQLTHAAAEISGENGSQTAPVLRVFDYKRFIKNLQNEFPAAAALGILERSESVSKASLTAAIENLRQRRVITVSPQQSDKKIVLRHDIEPELQLLKSMSQAIHGWLQNEPPYYDQDS